MGTFKVLPQIFSNINATELILSLLTIFIIYGFKRTTKEVPSTLVALFVVSAGAYFLKIDYHPIAAIPSGLPSIQLSLFRAFSLSTLPHFFFTALTLALLGAIDSLLTSVVADNLTKTVHRPNQELIGQEIGNSIGALFAGILITVGIGFMDYKGLKAIPFMPKAEFIILMTVLVLRFGIWSLP